MPHLRLPIELPPCGTFVGSGIMNSKEGYLVGSGKMHTTWSPQLFTPTELLDKILEDNQGNFVQYWGFSGGLGPVTFARHHALEDIGITPPEPDWENRKNLVVKDWVNPEDYKERFGAGVLKLIKAARDKGLYIMLLYTESQPQWSQQFIEAGGKYYLGYDFGERFTFRFEHESVASRDTTTHSERKIIKPEDITLQTLADDLMQRVAAHVDERHAAGWGNVAATSGNFYLDYEIAAGADIPMVEDFCGIFHLTSAQSRGLYRQYKLPIWGSHLAHEHYSWIPYASPHKFDLLRVAFYQKYMAGCKLIMNESGGWYLEAALVEDSPMFQTTRVVPGRHNKRDPYVGAPFVKEARETFHHINYHSPIAKKYRKEISDFYDFVKKNGTPQGQPETTLAIIKGNLDLGGSSFNPNGVVAGMNILAEENPLWLSGQPERGWNIVSKVFFPRPPVLAPWLNSYLSSSPYGQVDITSFAADNVDAEFLSANYKALVFAGWNTATDKQYAELVKYVKNGGILFLALPHLSKNISRKYATFTVDELINGGDFSELCGVKVKGRGLRFYWATAPDEKDVLGFTFPRRFGVLSICMGDIDITDPEAEVLVTDDEDFKPVVIRRRLGKGEVYFLNTWAYPGATESDVGPGAKMDSPGLVGYIYKHIAKRVRGSVYITDDGEDPGAECNFVSYSYFPEDGKVCLQNIDFENPHSIHVHHSGTSELIQLAAGEFRFLQAQAAKK